ncbi:MAG: NUDIX hydrolase [Myxococcales bacterium]|nr:NUDIX hydrolase [Myxococcales bacterium]
MHWDNPIPVVAAVVRWNSQFVIARNAKWPPGMFSMITGFVERNENPMATLRRELKEELGLDLAGAEFIGHFVFPEANQLIVAFLAHGVGSVSFGSELAEVKMLTNEEAETYNFGMLGLTSTIFRKATSMVAKVDGEAIAEGEMTHQ